MKNTGKLRMLIAYLKIVTVFMALYCLAAMFFMGFDPWHSLDRLIFNDLGITGEPSAEASKLFTFMFMLFNLLSIIYFIVQYFLVSRVIARGEMWACNVLLVCIFTWVLGATAIVLVTKAYAYFISIAGMALLLLPPLTLIKLQGKANIETKKFETLKN